MRAIRDNALIAPVVADFPAFGEIGFGADRLSEDCSQPSTAPAQAFQEWNKPQRLHGAFEDFEREKIVCKNLFTPKALSCYSPADWVETRRRPAALQGGWNAGDLRRALGR